MKMHARQLKPSIVFRRAGQVIWSSTASQSSSNEVIDLVALQASRSNRSDGEIICDNDIAEQDTADSKGNRRKSNTAIFRTQDHSRPRYKKETQLTI